MRHVLIALAVAALPVLAWAQALSEPASDARFQIEKSGNVFIRLDRTTGAISTCTLDGSALDCRSSADERAALQEEIDRLAAEMDRLKGQTASEEPRAGLSKDGKELTLKLPTEDDIRHMVSVLEDMLRRVVEAIKDLAGEKT